MRWADTEVAPPDTVLLFDDRDRAAIAESEWFTESISGHADASGFSHA